MQKKLADMRGLNKSTIRNYELGNRYPAEVTLLNIANNLGISFYALSDPNVANIFSVLHVLFDIEWAYGLHPTIKMVKYASNLKKRFQVLIPAHRNTFITSIRWWSIEPAYKVNRRMAK